MVSVSAPPVNLAFRHVTLVSALLVSILNHKSNDTESGEYTKGVSYKHWIPEHYRVSGSGAANVVNHPTSIHLTVSVACLNFYCQRTGYFRLGPWYLDAWLVEFFCALELHSGGSLAL